MLSILIPVYNYDITQLVSEIHKQAIKSNVDFEIICLDDKSNSSISQINSSINELSYTSYLFSESNNGIAITRQHLCNYSKYDWILLLDADVELRDDLFISNYLNALQTSKYDIVFGGISYKNEKPQQKSLLRWKYGKQCEGVTSKERNKTPYKITSAANILIKKEQYNRFRLDSVGNSYGMDIFFGPQLKLHKVPVLHIDNSVYHLGLEDSETYINKTEFAVNTLLNLHYNGKIKIHENDLLSKFILLKSIKLNFLFSLFYKSLKNILRKHLLSSNPLIILFQFYKISYMCYSDLNRE
ncbi:glycosyltransferase family 2 protein [Hyunsoonleella pacifica]|uniref:Glycosyltransferase family 2 protein n=1 Tax=Hyunsoonleella pacifica TaxID=1080224 RepID=A0A4Q9FJV6_9FLAO|nr:glycosyltransferase family 2 protein [Hyunsoonleella pacifica]TBN13927.1 glycosyltransferase family 2 protein [Hyunsoonleella pacifica]GGD26847.1 glycosyl transferase [Hyunsoonleella pacifica]